MLILSGCSGTITYKQTQPSEFVSTLAQDDRFALEFFFRRLIQEDSIGYVLLGEKPMGFHSYLKPKTIVNSYHSQPIKWVDLFFFGFDNRDALFEKGLKIWKEHEHKFCGKNIFFNITEEDEELHFVYVSVINKRLILPLLDQYSHKLGISFQNSESLFNALLHDQQFKKKFYSRDDLLGICLGYGERNADLFQKRSKLLTSMGRLGFTLESPSPNCLKRLEEECAILEKSMVRIKDHRSRKFLFSVGVGFCADATSPETPLLQKKYASLHKRLTQVYDCPDFLEKTLELISLENSHEGHPIYR